MADEKKLLERKALDAFLFNNRKLKKYEIDDNERPDFILEKDGYKIGIEHFRADTILNEHTDSESMKYDGQRRAMFKKHNKALQKDEFNADAAANDVEAYINKSLAAASNFKYDTFINNLVAVFEQHVSKVSEYKKKCNEVWFLIDIGIENNHFIGFLDNGGLTTINVLPITCDMLKIFEKYKDISRVIVCSRYLEKYQVIYDLSSEKSKSSYKFCSFTYTEAMNCVNKKIKLNVLERKGDHND